MNTQELVAFISAHGPMVGIGVVSTMLLIGIVGFAKSRINSVKPLKDKTHADLMRERLALSRANTIDESFNEILKAIENNKSSGSLEHTASKGYWLRWYAEGIVKKAKEHGYKVSKSSPYWIGVETITLKWA